MNWDAGAYVDEWIHFCSGDLETARLEFWKHNHDLVYADDVEDVEAVDQFNECMQIFEERSRC